jgi:hypothetical protein
MKTITLEVEDNYWLEIASFLKKFPIKIIEEKNSTANQKTPLEEIGFMDFSEENEKLSLSKSDAEIIANLINNPPAPNLKMREAVKLYQQSELSNAQS